MSTNQRFEATLHEVVRFWGVSLFFAESGILLIPEKILEPEKILIPEILLCKITR
jgi:hypothetical protein